MSQSLTLYRLQIIDTQVDRACIRLENIQKTLDDDASLKQSREQADASEANLLLAKSLQKRMELEVQELRIKIEQIESSLYSGAVHNPKELQDLQNDATSMRKYILVLEDRLLESMIATEDAQKKNEEAKTTLSRVNAKWGSQNESLYQEQANLKKDLQKLGTERHAITESLSPEHINLYEQLRLQRHGVAVTGIEESSCTSCGTTLTQALIQAARSQGQLSRCPTCGRILFAS